MEEARGRGGSSLVQELGSDHTPKYGYGIRTLYVPVLIIRKRKRNVYARIFGLRVRVSNGYGLIFKICRRVRNVERVFSKRVVRKRNG